MTVPRGSRSAIKRVLALVLGIFCLTPPRVTTSSALVNPFFGSSSKKYKEKPKLVLIGGCPGTGKSTFGMSVALQEGILKCISTDTVRAVMRSFVPADVSPALHRSSYSPAFEQDDAVRSWKECCTVLHTSVESLVRDAIQRKTSLVVEGVHLIPSDEFINMWQEHGGVAMGCLLQVSAEDDHKELLKKRGYTTGNMEKENCKINAYARIRVIQDEMQRLADQAGWMRIEQRIEPDPLDMIGAQLYGLAADDKIVDVARKQMVFATDLGSDSTATSSSTTFAKADEPINTTTMASSTSGHIEAGTSSSLDFE